MTQNAKTPQQLTHFGADAREATEQDAQHRSEGRIIVDAFETKNANGSWFTPGNGRSEWFKDMEDGPELVVVPAGDFTMGSTPDDIAALSRAYPNGTTGVYPDDTDWWETEGPQRTVTIAHPFAAGRHAVTRGQFSAFVRETGYEVKSGAYTWKGTAFERDPDTTWTSPGFPQDDTHPVVCINWHDACEYVTWLSQKSGKSYHLPSEAEREYITRAATVTPFWWGGSISTSDANYDGNHTFGGGPKGSYRQATLPVESFAANPWGLYQVHGNVWEWCADFWNDSYQGAPKNGAAWVTSRTKNDCDRRVIRGGSWVLSPQLLRSANRLFNPAIERSHDLGFRVIRAL